jgi:peptide/nickel transport system permease protein
VGVPVPCGVLVLIILCANLVGDGLRDALDPSARPAAEALQVSLPQ